MNSHYFLPYILHPTRVIHHFATVIDNIFSNNTAYDTFSGNIPLRHVGSQTMVVHHLTTVNDGY